MKKLFPFGYFEFVCVVPREITRLGLPFFALVPASCGCAEAEPVLESFKLWLQKKSETVLPSSLLGKAVDYALREWSTLLRFLVAACLTPDTNAVEYGIRPFCVGRKNWLFNGNPAGALAGAALFGLIETAKANNIEPYRYLRHIFEQIPLAKDHSDLEELLPYRIDAEALNSRQL